MNTNANTNAANATDDLAATAAALNAAQNALDQARQAELTALAEARDRLTARLQELKAGKGDVNVLDEAVNPSLGRTVLRVAGVTAAVLGVTAVGLWAYGRFSGNGAEEVVQATGEAIANAGDAIANAA